MTQNNLGNALQTLGERESGTARLEQAVAAYRAALEEYTRDRVPLDWAMSTGNQGVALVLLAERLGDATKARSAVQQIEVAFETMRNGGNAPAAAYYEAQLQKARAKTYGRWLANTPRQRSRSWCRSPRTESRNRRASAPHARCSTEASGNPRRSSPVPTTWLRLRYRRQIAKPK
jgi:hypothetical protein